MVIYDPAPLNLSASWRVRRGTFETRIRGLAYRLSAARLGSSIPETAGRVALLREPAWDVQWAYPEKRRARDLSASSHVRRGTFGARIPENGVSSGTAS